MTNAKQNKSRTNCSFGSDNYFEIDHIRVRSQITIFSPSRIDTESDPSFGPETDITMDHANFENGTGSPAGTESGVKQPKRRFVGRRTADAQAKQRDGAVSVEETTALAQRGG